MANLNGFNASEIEPTSNFEPLPAGKYLAAITESEMKPTKNGNRVLWARLNLNNPNATAEKIARSELSAICHAVGVMQPRDSIELHNLPLVIVVKLKKREDTGELTNEIRGYERKASAGQAQQAPVTDNTPPWKR